jgi:lysophospholipase L1-like esterase
VGNFGVGASTVLLESHKPYMNQAAFQNAKRFQPNIVIIMLGTNDAWPEYYTHLEEFVGDYKTLVNEFQSLSKPEPEVWLVKPPPVFNDSLGPNNANLVEGVIPRIEQVADELHLAVIGVYAVLIDHPDYFSDGVHPNSEGAKLIANEIYSAVIQNTVYS